jgi:hypothetical protein
MSQQREYQRNGPKFSEGFQRIKRRPLPASPIGEEQCVMADNIRFIYII